MDLLQYGDKLKNFFVFNLKCMNNLYFIYLGSGTKQYKDAEVVVNIFKTSKGEGSL